MAQTHRTLVTLFLKNLYVPTPTSAFPAQASIISACTTVIASFPASSPPLGLLIPFPLGYKRAFQMQPDVITSLYKTLVFLNTPGGKTESSPLPTSLSYQTFPASLCTTHAALPGPPMIHVCSATESLYVFTFPSVWNALYSSFY